MRTTKPIATISFNSIEYLTLKLNELLKNKIISFWAFVPHFPEDDEGGKKQHNHVYVIPSKMLQTDDLRDHLKEFDPQHPSKPLGCLLWNTSKFDDWYLYGLHDPRYLASKGQSRKYHYLHEDFITCDSDELLALSSGINRLNLSIYDEMLSAKNNGLSFRDYFNRGTVPIQLIKQYQTAWDLLTCDSVNRNGRVSHTPKADDNLDFDVELITPTDSELL